MSLPFIYSLLISDSTISEGTVYILLHPCGVANRHATIGLKTEVSKLTLLLYSRATVFLVDFHQSTECYVVHLILLK